MQGRCSRQRGHHVQRPWGRTRPRVWEERPGGPGGWNRVGTGERGRRGGRGEGGAGCAEPGGLVICQTGVRFSAAERTDQTTLSPQGLCIWH